MERLATATWVQGVLTPFDRLEGYERKVQTGIEAAGASDNGPMPQPPPGAVQTFLPLWLTLLPCYPPALYPPALYPPALYPPALYPPTLYPPTLYPAALYPPVVYPPALYPPAFE